MIHVFIDDGYKASIKPSVLKKTASAVLKRVSPDRDVDLTIVIQGNEALQQLNRQFLGNDAPTDVLSFPSDETDPDSGRPYLGDIAISYPIAESQAAVAGHPVQSEVQLLVVHGVLHLLGYDHTSPELKSSMWQVQSEVLTSLAVQIHKLPED